MAVTIPATGTGTATPVVATESITSEHYQFMKLVDGAAMLTAGWCVVAAVLLPGIPARGDGQLLGPAAYRMLRGATWWAAGWAPICSSW